MMKVNFFINAFLFRRKKNRLVIVKWRKKIV